MKYSENQIRAIKKIEILSDHFGYDHWFIQEEVVGAGYKTLMALVNKRFLILKSFDGMNYYQRTL
jgi:hypothetical protein